MNGSDQSDDSDNRGDGNARVMTAREWADALQASIKGKPVKGYWTPPALMPLPERPELLKAIPLRWTES